MSFSAAVLCAHFLCPGDQKVEKLYGVPSSNIHRTRMHKLQEKRVLDCRSTKKCHFFLGHSHINFQMARLVNTNSRPFSPGVCQVKSGDTEGSIGPESVILHQQMLEKELQIAISEENYVKAAKIRDDIKNLYEDSKNSVLAANARFYNAFRSGDLAAMQELWSRGDTVCCVHPGSLGISGYEMVIDSWNLVWANYEFPLEIELRDVRVHVRGELGYVTCVELVKTKGSSWGGQYVTNVFEKVDGRWFICIHHASPFDF